ncbi:MAG: DEAD/DEAH box helicase [Gammaproteobacteria bacterium]|jgi:hypothetical protein
MAKTRKPQRKPQKNTHRQSRSLGWLTTDADETERRRLRGLSEPFRIESPTKGNGFFGPYRVHSAKRQSYRVEIRSLSEPLNSCDCPDHRINGLGTCKHIEATLHRLKRRQKRAFRDAALKGSPFIEVFLDRRDHQVRIHWPNGARRRSRARELIAPFFNEAGVLAGTPLDSLPAMLRAVETSPPAVRHKIRISRELHPWLETLDQREQLHRLRQHFETEAASGRASLDPVKHTLYPYQQEGMLHLAFTGRALLADEMGLGKTVQAIAACELLRRTAGIQRVLVICPASLKGEWEEQIAKFTDLPSRIIQGPRARRLPQYAAPAFFYLVNYEQVRPDAAEINATLAPDVIILDEAQRIKNWQTRTAMSVKRLKSPYAFVLTGTPLENRIDEVYSITQFLDPHIFGPLFRFNREFYQLDEKGRAVGYRNLDRLHARIKPIMLRRRKEDVEGQLPGRTVNSYFVPMHKEQTLRYDEYESRVARLAAAARERPLRKEEMERLQQYLACMRMLCDSPYILDQSCRISPKLKELGNILQEIMDDGDHKVIIFSEWERMLALVREQSEQMGLDWAWHTGRVPQPKRREEIRRFKNDPECRLLLSSDSGSVGLNLQVADIVINLDIPWNPARLEQRIARAWRKHQERPVQVINLVSEGTIEHRMLALLEQKRSLARRVVDGEGTREMRLPSGRAAFLERLNRLMGTEPESSPPGRAPDPIAHLCEEVNARWSGQLELMELHGEGEHQTLLVVAKRLDSALHTGLSQRLKQLFPEQTPDLKLLDQDTFRTVEQLIQAGVLSAKGNTARTLYQATDEETADTQSQQLAEARSRLAQSGRKRRMAKLLADGGFSVEALAPMGEAVEQALHALVYWRGHDDQALAPLDLIDSTLVKGGVLPAETLSLVARLRKDLSNPDEIEAARLLEESDNLISRANTVLESER